MSCAPASHRDAATNKTRFFSAKIVRYSRLHTQHATEVTAMEKSASRQDASHRDAATTLFLGLALGALWFVCCRHLSEEWRFNEQYSYGWFVPFFVAFLFWLRWEDRPSPDVRGPAFAGLRRGRQRSDVGGWCAAISIVGAAIILLP